MLGLSPVIIAGVVGPHPSCLAYSTTYHPREEVVLAYSGRVRQLLWMDPRALHMLSKYLSPNYTRPQPFFVALSLANLIFYIF